MKWMEKKRNNLSPDQPPLANGTPIASEAAANAGLLIIYPSGQALAEKFIQFNFRNIEPADLLWSIYKLKTVP